MTTDGYTEEQRVRIGGAALALIYAHRSCYTLDPEKQHNPCCAFFCVDGPHGFFEPINVCACKWPTWEVKEKRQHES